MRQVKKMGPLQSIIGMLPGVPKELRNAEIDEGELGRVEAIICSMTPERARATRRSSTARGGCASRRGAARRRQQVNALLKQFKQVQQMMRSITKPGKKGKRDGAACPQLPPGLTPEQLGGIPGRAPVCRPFSRLDRSACLESPADE